MATDYELIGRKLSDLVRCKQILQELKYLTEADAVFELSLYESKMIKFQIAANPKDTSKLGAADVILQMKIQQALLDYRMVVVKVTMDIASELADMGGTKDGI